MYDWKILVLQRSVCTDLHYWFQDNLHTGGTFDCSVGQSHSTPLCLNKIRLTHTWSFFCICLLPFYWRIFTSFCIQQLFWAVRSLLCSRMCCLFSHISFECSFLSRSVTITYKLFFKPCKVTRCLKFVALSFLCETDTQSVASHSHLLFDGCQHVTKINFYSISE